MTITVIITAHNDAQVLAEALDSIVGQTRQPEQILVVDDGSTDETASVARRYPSVTFIQQPHSGRPGSTRNRGLQAATGDYIAFLDGDDIATADRLERQARFLDDHPSVGACFCDFREFQDSVEPVAENGGHQPPPKARIFNQATHFETCPQISRNLTGVDNWILDPDLAREILLTENYGSPCALMFRREVLASVPGFTDETRIGEDIRFTHAIAKKYDIGLMDFVGFLRRRHGRSISANKANLHRDNVVLYGMIAAYEKGALRELALEKQREHARILSRIVGGVESIRMAWMSRSPRMLARSLVMAARRPR